MKTGRSLQAIAQELERQVETRKDFLVPQGVVEPRVVQGEVVIDGINGTPFKIRPFAHQQFSDYLSIPRKYYERMRTDAPDLLAQSLKVWLNANPEEKRLIRTLDGQLRGFLSPKFRPLDNYDLAQASLPTLLENEAQILSAELTETRFYVKAILPKFSDELPEGLVWGSGHTNISRVAPNFQLPTEQQIAVRGRGRVVSALTISNSEVGAGTLRFEPSVFTTWCTNLAILVQAAMKKYHVGRNLDANDNFEVFADATREADNKAFWLKVRDVTKASLNEAAFKAAVAQIAEAGREQIESTDLKKVVDLTVEQLSLPVSTGPNILGFLARGGDLTKWGLSSAVTAVANEFEDYEGATALERAGGQILALPAADWERIANAA